MTELVYRNFLRRYLL